MQTREARAITKLLLIYTNEKEMMGVNRDKPDRWKEDVRKSVDFYNNWFLDFAPKTFRESRVEAIKQVQQLITITADMTDFSTNVLVRHPEMLSVLRMCTAPPLARDRLIGLAGTKKHLVNKMEKEFKIPNSYKKEDLEGQLNSISKVLKKMLDADLFVWVEDDRVALDEEKKRAATVIADRLTGAVYNPILRNAQEKRQLYKITQLLEERNYRELTGPERVNWQELPSGTYGMRMNVSVENPDGKTINIPLDVIIQPKEKELKPLLIEAKSAGDFTNVNKRRKEEAQKLNQLRSNYGDNIRYILFLCGYFDSGYLGYEAAEGIDWVWEHRIEDLIKFGI